MENPIERMHLLVMQAFRKGRNFGGTTLRRNGLDEYAENEQAFLNATHKINLLPVVDCLMHFGRGIFCNLRSQSRKWPTCQF